MTDHYDNAMTRGHAFRRMCMAWEFDGSVRWSRSRRFDFAVILNAATDGWLPRSNEHPGATLLAPG
jgi:hypothetical protein